MTGRLAGKTALVTGAGRGIGGEIARAFAREGAAVWACDLEPPAVQHGDTGAGSMRALALDVTDEAAWVRVMADMAAAGAPLTTLVNNAGISGVERGAAHDPENAELEEWRRVMGVNLDGVFLGCRAAIRAMRTAGSAGTIVNVASRSGQVGVPGAAAYAASKAAVINHTRSVALYCASQGLPIRCNAIAPGAVLTPMWEAMLGDGPDREERVRMFTGSAALKRFADPSEVAALAVLLASDEVSYMTGETIALDGGLAAGSGEMP